MSKDLKLQIGSLVRAHRTRCGLTQEELADRIERHADSLSLIERGQTLPSIETLLQLAEAMDLSPLDLLPSGKQAMGSQKKTKLEADIRSLLSELSENELLLAKDMVAIIRSHQST